MAGTVGPETRTIPTPAAPGALAMAAMVSAVWAVMDGTLQGMLWFGRRHRRAHGPSTPPLRGEVEGPAEAESTNENSCDGCPVAAVCLSTRRNESGCLELGHVLAIHV